MKNCLILFLGLFLFTACQPTKNQGVQNPGINTAAINANPHSKDSSSCKQRGSILAKKITPFWVFFQRG
jgi:hypothetical protein